MLQSTCI